MHGQPVLGLVCRCDDRRAGARGGAGVFERRRGGRKSETRLCLPADAITIRWKGVEFEG